ncbi:tetratricopeptide repeat protein [Nostoc sp.]|uniref:tetratricopeptide repeat protein n=1 Tax=Nostoc sp. TaxID=1180 RepID=UPI002FFB566B
MTPKQDKPEKKQPQLISQSMFEGADTEKLYANNIIQNTNQGIQNIYNRLIGPLNNKQRILILVFLLGVSIVFLVGGFVNLIQEGIILKTQCFLVTGCVLIALISFYKVLNKDRTWKLFAIVMIGIPLSTFVSVSLWMNTPTNNTIVTVAEYYEPDPAARNAITGGLLEKLQISTHNKQQDIVIKSIGKSFSSSQKGNVISEGNQRKATIAIWGWVAKNIKHPINTIVELLKEPLSFSISETAEKLKVGDEQNNWSHYLIAPEEVDVNIVSDTAIKSDTDYELAYLVNFTSGLAQYKAKNWQQAINRFNTALENIKSVKQSTPLDQSIVHFYSSNAHLYNAHVSKSKKSYNSAIDGFTKAIKLIPESYLTFYNRSNLNFGQYDHSVILASYKVSQLGSGIEKTDDREVICGNQKRDTNVLVDNTPSQLKAYLARVYYNRGLSYTLTGDKDKAFSDYIKAFQLDPEVDGLCIGLGSAYADKGKYNLATQNLEQAIRVNPKDALAHINLGNVYANQDEYQLGNVYANQDKYYQQAITQYAEAIRLMPDSADAYYNQAIVYFKLKRYDLALKDFDEALKRQPNFADAHIGRADVFFNDKHYVNAQNYNKAEKEYTKAISIDPENAQFYLIRGTAYQANKDYTGAIQDFNQVISLKQYFVYADAYLGLATTYKERYKEGKDPKDNLLEKDNLQKFYNLTKNLPPDIQNSMVEKHIKKYEQMRVGITPFQTKDQCNLRCSFLKSFPTTTPRGIPNWIPKKMKIPVLALARLYPKLRTRFSLSGKNPGFSANTFSTSQIIDEVKKVKLPDHRGFSDSITLQKKWIKSRLEAV